MITKVFDKFTIIIVDEMNFIVRQGHCLLERNGSISVCIIYGNLRQKVSEIVPLVYNEGEVPCYISR
jgi:hypothetical protein